MDVATRDLISARDERADPRTPPTRSSITRPVATATGPSARDRKLVAAAQRGDRQAFAEIVQQHQAAVFGFLRARLVETADAEDLCQEVFLRSYQGREKFGRATAIRNWLIGIARNVLREHVRRVIRRREVAWTELCLEVDDMLCANGGQAELDDALEHLPACLESLGQSARDALAMRYDTKLRLAEIGRRMNRSEGAVKLLIFRARQALKNCLDRKLGQTTP